MKKWFNTKIVKPTFDWSLTADRLEPWISTGQKYLLEVIDEPLHHNPSMSLVT